MTCTKCLMGNLQLIYFRSIRYLFNNIENVQTSETKRGVRVAVIGCPNAGKSALTNAIIRANVCAVSKQIDTTRHVCL